MARPLRSRHQLINGHENTRRARKTMAFAAVGLGLWLARAARSHARYDFRGRVVVVTGGSRGLGLVLARQLAAAQARVVLIARDAEELARAADSVRQQSPSADVLPIAADVRQRTDIERAVSVVMHHHGRLDVLINNAGIIQVGPLDQMTDADYQEAMRTHFWGPLHMTLAAVPHMRQLGEGRVVNISSIGGKIAVPHMLPYVASKFALTGLSDGLRVELARDNIRVTTVCPGLMRTGSPVNAAFKGQHAKEFAWFAIAGSMPGLTIGAERAARQILAACRRGDAELVITMPARLAALARAATPAMLALTTTIVNRLLPASTGVAGTPAQPGRTIETPLATSPLLTPMYAAARRNNEL